VKRWGDGLTLYIGDGGLSYTNNERGGRRQARDGISRTAREDERQMSGSKMYLLVMEIVLGLMY
jgi:hypothetical protein